MNNIDYNRNYKHKYLKYKKKYTELKLKFENLKGGDKPTSICNGKSDGVSGCRTCCNSNFPNDPSKYSQCVTMCMNV